MTCKNKTTKLHFPCAFAFVLVYGLWLAFDQALAIVINIGVFEKPKTRVLNTAYNTNFTLAWHYELSFQDIKSPDLFLYVYKFGDFW